MKVRATFVKDGKWWVAWTDDVPGASTQGRTIEAARRNLIDAIRELQAAPRSLSQVGVPLRSRLHEKTKGEPAYV